MDKKYRFAPEGPTDREKFEHCLGLFRELPVHRQLEIHNQLAATHHPVWIKGTNGLYDMLGDIGRSMTIVDATDLDMQIKERISVLPLKSEESKKMTPEFSNR